jgi:hypothetical protein
MSDQANELRKLVRNSARPDEVFAPQKKFAGDLFRRASRQFKEAAKCLVENITSSKTIVSKTDASTSVLPLLNLNESKEDYQELIQL